LSSWKPPAHPERYYAETVFIAVNSMENGGEWPQFGNNGLESKIGDLN
jgi:hypothetical protein